MCIRDSLFVAAPKAVYVVTNYEDYLPIQALDTEQFITEFLDRHRRATPRLARAHISTKFSIFTCGLDLFDPEQITYHCSEIHGLDQGITSLSPLQVIDVREEIKFISPSFLEIENMGEENQAMLADSLYYRCVASGIFVSANNGKNTADLKSHRTQDLLNGIKDVSNKYYFGRFHMILGNVLSEMGKNISGNFTCKWPTLEKALFLAIGEERNVNRATT